MGLSFTAPMLTFGRDSILERSVGHPHDRECKEAAEKRSICLRVRADVLLLMRYLKRALTLICLGDDLMPAPGKPIVRYAIRRTGDLFRGLWYVPLALVTFWFVLTYGFGRVLSLKMMADETDSHRAGLLSVFLFTYLAACGVYKLWGSP